MLQWQTPIVPQFDVTQSISFETVEFSLTVFVNGSAQESFTGLSFNPSHPRYVENIVNRAPKGTVGSFRWESLRSTSV